MTSFAYTGRSAVGPVSGTLEGTDAGAIADLLFARGVTPLKIEAEASARPASDAAGKPGRRWFEPKVGTVELMLFCRQLHTLLRAGVPILRALLGLQESATHRAFRDCLAEVRRSLESGIELSMSFAQQSQLFTPFFVAMVRVGEMTGRLDEVFDRLCKHLEFEMFMHQQVKSALRYPMFVMIATVGRRLWKLRSNSHASATKRLLAPERLPPPSWGTVPPTTKLGSAPTCVRA